MNQHVQNNCYSYTKYIYVLLHCCLKQLPPNHINLSIIFPDLLLAQASPSSHHKYCHVTDAASQMIGFLHHKGHHFRLRYLSPTCAAVIHVLSHDLGRLFSPRQYDRVARNVENMGFHHVFFRGKHILYIHKAFAELKSNKIINNCRILFITGAYL